MVRILIGNKKSSRVEVRSVGPDAKRYLVLCSVFETGLEGGIDKVKNLRQANRYLPDNIYDALDNFNKAEWTGKLLGVTTSRPAAPASAGPLLKPPNCNSTTRSTISTYLWQYRWNQFYTANRANPQTPRSSRRGVC